MKFPKLKNVGWCRFFYLAPLWLPILLFLGWFAFEINVKKPEIVSIIIVGCFFIFLMLAGITIHYILFVFSNAIERIDAVLAVIFAWKRDCKKYKSKRNGIGKEEITRRITRRCKGKDCEPSETQYRPIVFKRRGETGRGAALYTDYIQMVFTTDHLDSDTFRDIIRDAGTQFAAEIERLHGKRRIAKLLRVNNDRFDRWARVCAVVILADSVDEEAAKLAREKVSCKRGYILPCAVNCTEGIYYLDAAMMRSMTHPFRDEKSFAHLITEKIVFGGRLPKGEDADREPLNLDPDISPDMSLWELIRLLHKKNREADKQLDAEGARMMEKLRDGEVHIGDESIFCRIGDRMAVTWYQEVIEGEYKGLKVVYIPYRWLLPRGRKISKSDRENLRRIIGDKLRSEGIDFAFADDDITTVRQSSDRRNDK